MTALDIIDRLRLLSRGNNLDLADIVCADAMTEIKRLRNQVNISDNLLSGLTALVESLKSELAEDRQ